MGHHYLSNYHLSSVVLLSFHCQSQLVFGGDRIYHLVSLHLFHWNKRQQIVHCVFDKIIHARRHFRRSILIRPWKRLHSIESEACGNDDVPMEILKRIKRAVASTYLKRINCLNFYLVWALLSDFSPIWQVFLNCFINTCTACNSYLCRVYHISNSTSKSAKFQERLNGRVNLCIDLKETSVRYVILHVQCTLLRVFQYCN